MKARRGRQHSVTGEGTVRTADGQIGSEDHRAAFVALREDLEEQAGPLPTTAADLLL
jgi:hypothetical protein